MIVYRLCIVLIFYYNVIIGKGKLEASFLDHFAILPVRPLTVGF